MPLIEAKSLSKVFHVRRPIPGRFGFLRSLLAPRFDVVEAVRDISFTIAPGECVGYLGPNGAGKSTTIKMLTGILVPTRGEVRVGGIVPWRDRCRNAHQIGAVFGQRTQLYWDLPLVHTLELLRQVYEIPERVYNENLAVFRDLLRLDDFLHVPVRQLSLGQRMRGELAAALLHAPAILYLDEPTIGLDVVAREHILQIIREMNQRRGVTVILTTHNLAEVEQLCSRIILINRGQLLYDGSLEEFKHSHAPYRTLVVQLAGDQPVVEIPGTEVIRGDARTLLIRFPRDEMTPQHLIHRVTERYEVKDLSLTEPSLEHVIRQFYDTSEEGEGLASGS